MAEARRFAELRPGRDRIEAARRLLERLEAERGAPLGEGQAALALGSEKMLAAIHERLWRLPPEAACMRLRLALMIAWSALVRQRDGTEKNRIVAVCGPRGSGKTTYAMWAAYGAYRILGFPREKAWQMVLGLTFWSAEDFARWLDENYREGVFAPVVILDDAGVYFSKYWMQKGQVALAWLLEKFDMYKDVIGVIVATMPVLENIAKRVRDLVDVWIEGDERIVAGRPVTVWWIQRRVLVHVSQLTPSGARHGVRRAWAVWDVDTTPSELRIPDGIWAAMKRRRFEIVRRDLRRVLLRLGGAQEQEEASGEGGSEE